MRDARRLEWGSAAVVVALGLVYWALVPAQIAPETAPFGISGRFFPRLIAIMAVACGSVLLVRSLLTSGRPDSSADETLGFESAALGRVAIYVAILIGYVVGMAVLGYVVATAIAMVLLLLHAGARDWPTVGVVAVAVPAGLYLFFEKVMIVPLPRGLLF